MKRGIQNFCHGSNSTTILNQGLSHDHNLTDSSVVGSCNNQTGVSSPPTLEQMILQLDLEEEAARKAKLEEAHYFDLNRRMSCVNNSDILKSARNALNQYPRFSLDGKDSMYRSSFRPVCRSRVCKERNFEHEERKYKLDLEKSLKMPQKLAGESVIWCKPSIVAKLMGLDVVPVPVNGKNGRRKSNVTNNPLVSRKQNLRRLARRELERERLFLAMNGASNKGKMVRDGSGSGSGLGYHCGMSPVEAVEAVVRGKDEWRYRRAR
ncbi:hypothetical protein LUZ60_004031 [Juncus effusus]|nr:hypothetical protein LUZ60_004031 [Juncus effusus]